ncbi:MAG: hypothetical protein ACR2PT_16160 [Endozoicomonas sp.]
MLSLKPSKVLVLFSFLLPVLLTSVAFQLVQAKSVVYGKSEVYNNCEQFPQKYRAGCERFRTVLDKDSWFTSLQLVNPSEELSMLLGKSDGTTAFFLSPGQYKLESTVYSNQGFALVGLTVEGETAEITPGESFGSSLESFFEIQAGSAKDRTIFDNLIFKPELSPKETPELSVFIHSSFLAQNLILSALAFSTSAMKAHSLPKLISLEDIRGNVSVVNSSLDLNSVTDTGVYVGCQAGSEHLEYCGRVLFQSNLGSGNGEAGFLTLSNVPYFTLNYNTLSLPTGGGNTEKPTTEDGNSAFSLSFHEASPVIQGEIQGNRITGSARNYAAISLSAGEKIDDGKKVLRNITLSRNDFNGLPILGAGSLSPQDMDFTDLPSSGSGSTGNVTVLPPSASDPIPNDISSWIIDGVGVGSILLTAAELSAIAYCTVHYSNKEPSVEIPIHWKVVTLGVCIVTVKYNTAEVERSNDCAECAECLGAGLKYFGEGASSALSSCGKCTVEQLGVLGTKISGTLGRSTNRMPSHEGYEPIADDEL